MLVKTLFYNGSMIMLLSLSPSLFPLSLSLPSLPSLSLSLPPLSRSSVSLLDKERSCQCFLQTDNSCINSSRGLIKIWFNLINILLLILSHLAPSLLLSPLSLSSLSSLSLIGFRFRGRRRS